MHQKLINLNTRLHTIEQAHAHGDAVITSVQARLDLEDAINKLEAETKHIMITTAKSFLNTKMNNTHQALLRSSSRCRTICSWHHQHHNRPSYRASARLASPQQA
jgi:hypothetical protein